MMIDNSAFTMMLSGVMLGAASGMTPGPINALIISESLKHNRTAGVKVAISPLITDSFIVPLCIFIVTQISKIEFVLGIITLCGAAFLMYLGGRDLIYTPELSLSAQEKSRPLLKGIVTNFLTPHPFIFWITIGGPIFTTAYASNEISAILFIIGFYSMLVGFKILLALFTEKMKRFFQGRAFTITIKLLGGFLILIGILLLVTGIQKLTG